MFLTFTFNTDGFSTVNFTTSSGTAIEGTDYTSNSGTLTFAPGETSKLITLTLNDESIYESSETFNITLSNPGSASLGATTSAVVTITDNDSPPVVQFSAAAYSGAETGSITVTANLTGSTALNATVNYATSNGTAAAGTDYSAASGTLTFLPGQTSKTFTVTPVNAATYRGDRTVNLTLSSPTGATLGATSTATLTITDDDPVTSIQLASATYSVNEGSSVIVTVNRTVNTVGTSTVNYATSDGTATAGTHYTAASGTLNFAAGETSKTITISTGTNAGSRNFNLTLSSPGYAVLGAQISALITTVGIAPTFSGQSPANGVLTTNNTSIFVTASDLGGINPALIVMLVDGSSVATSFNAGTGVISAAVTLDDGPHTINVSATNMGGTQASTSWSYSTLVHGPTVTWANNGMTTNSASPYISIDVSASIDLAEWCTMTLNGQSVSASFQYPGYWDSCSGTYYVSDTKTGTITYQTSNLPDGKYILVIQAQDYLGNTTTKQFSFTVNHFSSAAYSVTEGNSVVVSVSLSGTTYLTASVHYAASNGTAIVDRDTRPISGVLTFAPGETSKTFTVYTVDDVVYEGNETLVLSLSLPNDAELGTPNNAVLTIVDNDPVSTAFYNPHGNYEPGTDACVKCHITHQATGVGSLFYLVTEKLTCYICHNGAAANGNIKAELGENVVGTSVYSSYHPLINGPQLCTSCHNPHTGPASKPALLEVGASKVSSGNAVCAQCHGAGTAIDGGDITTSFTGTAHDTSMTNPTSGTQIKCIRCHQPHGSSNKPLLQSKIVDDSSVSHNVYGNDNSLCYACHSSELRSFPGGTVYNATYHGTKTTSTVAAVTYSGIEYTATPYTGTLCLNCHDPHGKTGVANYRRAAGNDLCYKCHDADGISLTATYSYRGRTEYEQGAHATARATGLTTFTSSSSGFLAWEGTSEPTPSSPGTVMSTAKISAMTSNDAYWATTSLATSGQTDYQMYRFKPSLSTLLLRGLTATWTGYGETVIAAPYSRPITITGSTSGALTNYQVAVTVDTASLVTAGKMRSDGADIRFTNSTGVQLPYWIESGMNTNATKIWVKVDSIPNGSLTSPNNQTTIYLNYGDPNLTVGASDIKSTMIYYDDFSSVDPGWTNANITGGVLKIGGGVNNGASHPLTGASPGQVYIEYDYAFGPGNGTTQAGSNFFGNNYIRPHRVYGDLFTNTDFGQPYITGITWNETSHKIKVWWWGGGANQFKIGCDSSVATGTLSSTGNVNNISFYLDSASWGPSVIDNLLVRKYASPEPTASSPGAETGSLPTTVYIWNNTLNTGSGGWELLQNSPMYADTTVTAQKTNPTDYINSEGYVYMMAKGKVATGLLHTNSVGLGLASLTDSSAGLCDNCHAPHGKTDSNGNLYPKQLQATPNTVCFGGNIGCHSDSINSQHSVNLLERFTASANALAHHSVDPTEQQTNGSKVDCKNCHDPHVSTGIIDPYYPTTPFPVNYTSSDINTYIGAGGEVYVMTTSKHDGAVPVITSGPTVFNMSATGCTVTWTTDQATNGFIEYGTTTGYGTEQVSINADPAPYIHTVRLTDLVPGQNYHFQVRSYDPVGNYKFSNDALLDGGVPTITSGPTADLEGDNTTIYWNTDEPSTTVVHYGPSDVESYVYTSSNSNFSTTHSVTIPTPAGSNYHFQIQSVDYRGNTVTGNDTLINNSTTPPSVPVLIDPAPLPTGQNTVSFTLNWNSSTDPNNYTPISYTAQLSRLPDFSTIAQTVQNQAGTSWNLSITDDYGLTPVTWYWRVRARNSEGADSAWASSSFTHTPAASPSACPNLYVWNGSKYVFVTDLAASSVGQLDGVNKNKFAEVFPDLNVAIPLNLLQEKDGKYSIKIKSERDEVDFIDNVALMAVDHPVGTKVALNDLVRGSQPNEIYAYSENLRPVKQVTYNNGMSYSGTTWRTDYYAAPNTGDGKYNYQMLKFVISKTAAKIYSLKIAWQGWGEPSPGYPTTLNIWNFAQSRWDQIYSGVIGVNTGASTEKYVSFEPFCYKCHAGTRPAGVQLGTVPVGLQQGASNKNIQSTFTSDMHGGGSGQQTASGYANDYTSWSFAGAVSGGTIGGAYARANAALPCNDCHDTHGSNSVYHFREHINGDINQDLTNYPNGNKVPTAEYADNASMLHFCQSCHVGTLRQFHGACLDCHIAGDNWEHTPAPTADDFGRACISCHYHGATYPAHGACHCYLNNSVKAF